MKELLDKISQLGINIDTDVMAQIGRYWLIKEAINDICAVIGFGIFFVLVYKVIKNFGTKKWSFSDDD